MLSVGIVGKLLMKRIYTMGNNVKEELEKIEKLVDLYEELLQNGNIRDEYLFYAEAILFFSKQTLKHAKNWETAERNGKPEEEIRNIGKKFCYCLFVVGLLNEQLLRGGYDGKSGKNGGISKRRFTIQS